MDSDLALLARYASDQSADAFTELVRRYAGLVFAAAYRITENRTDAEDISQECFLELARRADSIRTPLPTWLHKVATTRSINARRNSSARKRHEQQALTAHADSEPTWKELGPLVDELLTELPDDCREVLILHYLNGISQSDVAAQLSVDQSNVSRRIKRGIEELRGKLSSAGWVVSVPALVALLGEQGITVAPRSLIAGLGKMALSGVGQVPARSGSLFESKAFKIALTAGLIAAGLLTGLYLASGPFPKGNPSASSRTSVTRGVLLILSGAGCLAAGLGATWARNKIKSIVLTDNLHAQFERMSVELKVIQWASGILSSGFLIPGTLLGLQSDWNQTYPFVLLGMGMAVALVGMAWQIWVYLKLTRAVSMPGVKTAMAVLILSTFAFQVIALVVMVESLSWYGRS